MRSKINYSLFILLCLLPVLLVTGPFLPDFVASLIGLFFLLNIFNKNFTFLILNKYSLIFLFFCLSALLSSLLSDDIFLSFESSLFYFRFYFFSLGGFILISLYKNKINILFLVMSFCMLIVSLDAMYEHINGINIFGNSAFPGRLAGLFGDEWVIGAFLTRLLPIIFFLYLYYRLFENKNLKILFFVTIFFSISIIILSGERAALILFIIYSFSMYFIYIFKFIDYKKLFLLPFLILTISLPFLLIDKSYNRLISNFNNHLSLNKSENPYLSFYSNSVQMFIEKPILGHGPNMFRLECNKYLSQKNKYGCNTHPHNYYFQLLAENGIVGFSILLFFLFFVFKKLFYEIRNNKDSKHMFISKISLLLCFIINIWPFIPTHSFYNNWISVLICIPIIFYLKINNEKYLKF